MQIRKEMVYGVFALMALAFNSNAGFYRWTAYSKACWAGDNISVAWYNEHYLNYKTDVIHTNTKRKTSHAGSTGWQNTDRSSFRHQGEFEGSFDPWIVQGYHFYYDYYLGKPIYHWYSEANDCNTLEDSRDDYPQDKYP